MSQPSSSASQVSRAVYDLDRLFSLREAVTSLEPGAPPQVRVLASGPTHRSRRVGILCGSFNPLTLAHSQLAEQVCHTWRLDQVFLSLATRTVDKEQVTGLGLEDRLALLSLYAAGRPSMRVALVNRGLYVEQARAFRRLLGPDTELCFLTGMDKLVQILDPRYYQDRDASLRELFELAGLIVANRGELDQTAFRRLLAQPANRIFRPAIRFFGLSAAASALNDLSATTVRHALASGRSIDAHVPAETRAYLHETRVYQPAQLRAGEAIDAYAVRLALLRLLYSARLRVDFRRLMQAALAASPHGRRLRQACAEPSTEVAVELLRACLKPPDIDAGGGSG